MFRMQLFSQFDSTIQETFIWRTYSFFCRFKNVIESPKPVNASSAIVLMLFERRSKWRSRCSRRRAFVGMVWMLLSPKRRYCRYSAKYIRFIWYLTYKPDRKNIIRSINICARNSATGNVYHLSTPGRKYHMFPQTSIIPNVIMFYSSYSFIYFVSFILNNNVSPNQAFSVFLFPYKMLYTHKSQVSAKNNAVLNINLDKDLSSSTSALEAKFPWL